MMKKEQVTEGGMMERGGGESNFYCVLMAGVAYAKRKYHYPTYYPLLIVTFLTAHIAVWHWDGRLAIFCALVLGW